MAQTRGTFSQLHDNVDYRDVFVLLEGALKEEKPIWRNYYNVETSVRKTEITQSYTELGDVPEKPEGGSYATDVIRPAFRKDRSASLVGRGGCPQPPLGIAGP